jgi:hypothetical protein
MREDNPRNMEEARANPFLKDTKTNCEIWFKE